MFVTNYSLKWDAKNTLLSSYNLKGTSCSFICTQGFLNTKMSRERVPQEKERERECACRVIERSETVDYCVERTRGCNSTMLTTQIVVSHVGKLERLFVVFFI